MYNNRHRNCIDSACRVFVHHSGTVIAYHLKRGQSRGRYQGLCKVLNGDMKLGGDERRSGE